MTASTTRHPPPETILPSFRWRPLLVSGMPIRRDSRALAAEIPTARFQEKPPKPILFQVDARSGPPAVHKRTRLGRVAWLCHANVSHSDTDLAHDRPCA